MDTVVKECGQFNEAQIYSLYNSVGWSAFYTPDILRCAVASSLYVLGAYERDKLIGLLRAVGDGMTVALLQDILVHPEYQHRGIGRRLVAGFLQRYRNVRQIYVLTDNMPETVGFYQAVGFTPLENVHYRAFVRLRL